MNQENAGTQLPTTKPNHPTSGGFSPDVLADYEKCISCPDYGINCKGPKLAALRTISNVREYHRRLKECRKIQTKQICALVENEMGSSTVKEYFSHEEKDFRWTNVSAIDNAITYICGGYQDIKEIPNCPATSTDIKEQIFDFTEKLRLSEETCLSLQARIAENKGTYLQQMDDFRQDQQERIKWLKADIRLWRRFAFVLLGIVAVTFLVLIAYLALDIANPESGFFRY